MSPRPPQPPGTILRTAWARLDPVAMADEETMAAVRLKLLAELNEFADRCGYTRSVTRESLDQDRLTITGMMSPRTDGQWPDIHAAVAADAMDRQLLRNPGDPF